jgi:lipopolysaccharide transport system permease protein
MITRTWNQTWIDRLGHSADTLQTLVGRELNIRYKGSLLGMLWAILSPLGTVAVLYLLFTKILPLGIPHYPTFIYCGLLPWTWFHSAVQSGATALVDNRDLVKQPFFPKIVLPAVVTGTNYLLYLLALPVLALLATIDGVPITVAVLWLPVVWIALGIFTLACAVLVGAAGLLVRDIPHLLGVALMLWFYVTPVFYDVSQLSPGVASWFHLNPLTAVVQAHRAIVLEGRAPDWWPLASTAMIGIVAAFVGRAVFHSVEGTLVERV